MSAYHYLFHYFFAFVISAACGSSSAASLLDDFHNALLNGKTSHVLDVENDSLKLNRDDGLYSSGLRYTQRYALNSSGNLTVFGWRIGQELYTASDINLPPELVRAPDHPYAAWLYTGVFKEQHDSNGRRFRAGVDFGCLGPCAGGEATQNFLHGILDQPRPKAWGKQVKNEVGVVLYTDMTPVRWTFGEHIDAAPTVHGRFGNIFTDGGVGINVRVGRLNILPHQPTLHGFFRLDGRAVAHNASLQGGYFSNHNPHTVKPERFVTEAETGVAWHGASFGILLSIIRRSNEIRGLADSIGEQDFVRLTVSYAP